MSKHLNVFFLLVIIWSFPMEGFTQDDSIESTELQEVSLTPREQVNLLKDGALMVRLATKSNSIEALKKNGRIAQAEQIQKKQKAENLRLVTALTKGFNFCPVYFFYSDDSDYIREGKLDSVQFLNPDLTFNTEIRPTEEFYLTAELGLIEQIDYRDKNITTQDENNSNYRNEAKFYGGANMRFHALIVKDTDFKQLRNPFPYYSRTMNSFFMRKDIEEVVKVLNWKLKKFLAK